ncbi:MAG TPA: protein kinase [Polyangiaceae bacterium]|nr:protein kinase [Polyangiaceae bacterium]
MTSRFDDPDRADGDPDDHEPDDADDFLREVARVDDIAPPARAPSPGQTLGRFRILSELGRGGMGIVYLAHDENLRRAVALKLLSPSIARKDERTRRFLREARAAASVTHTNLATIYDVGEVEGNVFIAMERVEGRTLRKVLAAGRPSIEQAVDIATQILAGLAKAHLAGIVHRDLKPDNIMLTDDGVVKLLDFGLAKQHDGAASGVRAADVAAAAAAGSSDALDSAPHDTAENQLLGTPGYMSPEQVRNSLIDPRSDIFAFGVVFYEMLAGQRPFVGQTHADLASAILRDTPRRLGELRPEVPNELERLVERCLEKDPARRYPSSGALAIALAQLDLVGASRFATPSGSSPSGSTPAPDVLSTSGASAAVARTPSLMRRASERAGAAARIFGAVLVVSLAGLYFRSSRGGGDEVENDLAEARRDVAEARRDKAEAQRDKADAKRSTTEVEREQTVAAALAARSVPTPVTELPLPQSKSPEALVAYRAALQGIRDGNWGYVQAHLERALELDPGLAIAHLRLAMIRHHSPRMRPREQFAMAIAGRASMNEREQTLLHACEPLLYRDPPDPAEYVARLRVATERFPGDAELFGMLGWEQQDNPEAMLEGSRRAVELDPQYADGWQGVGAALFKLGKTDEALAALDRCVALSPATADCSGQRGSLHGSEGRCAEMDEDFRRAVAISINGMWQDGRAGALFALGGPPEAIIEVFRNKWAQLSEDEKGAAEHLDRSNLDIATGDFQSAERELQAARNIVASDTDAATHSQLAQRLMALYSETNRPKEAGRVAAEYLKRKDVWLRSQASDQESISMYWTLFRAKSMSRESFIEKRDTWARAHASDEAQARVVANYACGVETPEEARDALGLFPNVAPPRVITDRDASLAMFGKLYALAGSLDVAIPLLQRTVKSCYALMMPLVHTRSTYYLGQALEASGDRDGACNAYASVLARWGNAKPPSVTAGKARERARTLRCATAPARRAG